MTTLELDNWLSAVKDAIRQLPSDIQASVGLRSISDRGVAIQVACEPMLDEGEAHLSEVCIRLWDTRRDELATQMQDTPELAAEWIESEQRMHGVDSPSVSVRGSGCEANASLVVGRASVDSLIGYVQLAILDELWQGGSISMVSKDDEGRFFRDDGSLILEWQS
jgi:hypothetical protein